MACRIFLLVVFTFLFNSTIGQERTYNFLHFTVKEGLASDRIAGLAKDSKGLLWISTKRGLSYFDGLRFVDVNLNYAKEAFSNNLGRISIDQKDRLWITTHNRGLLCYDPSLPPDQAVKSFYAKVSNGDLIKSDLYDVLAAKSGLVYFGGQETNLQVLNPETGEVSLVHFPGLTCHTFASVYSLAEDQEGNIWIGTRYNGLLKYHPKTKQTLYFNLENPGENAVSSFALAPDAVYAGYYDHDVIRLDYDMKRFQSQLLHWNKNKDFYDNFASALAYLPKEDQLLVGHNVRGMEILHRHNGEIERISWDKLMPELPKPSRIQEILPVEQGYWIGSESGLFFYANPLNTVSTLISNPKYATEPIQHIRNWRGDPWYFTQTTFGKISQDFKQRLSSFSLDSLKISAIHATSSGLLFSTYDKGVYRFVEDRKKLEPLEIIGHTHGFGKADCNKLIVDTIQGIPHYWIGSWSSGLYKYNLSSKTMELYHEKNGLPNQKVISIGKDPRGDIWIGMDGFGLLLLKNKEHPDKAFEQFRFNEKRENALESNTIFSFFTDSDDRFWFSNLQTGIGEIIKQGNNYEFKQYRDDHALPWLHAKHMLEDGNKLIWMRTADGTMVFDKKNKQFHQLLAGKGIYPAEHINTYDVFLQGETLVWCTDKGLIIGNLRSMPFQQQPKNHRPILSRLMVSHQDQSYRLRKNKLVLAAKENNFSLSFSIPEQATGQPMRFAYQLKGQDEDWVTANAEQTAYYNNLKGGEYVFAVKVGDRFGNWSSEVLEIPIQMKSYWYATGWFKTLLALFFLSAIILFFAYRIHQQKKINRIQANYNEKLEEELALKVETIKIQAADIEREKQDKMEKDFKQKLFESELKAIRSQMNPHFIFNVLNSIEAYVVENDSRNASNLIQKFSSLSRIVLENSQYSIVSIKSEIQLVRLYLELEQHRFNHAFIFEIAYGKALDEEIKIPSMLIQPLVENAVHHGIRHLKDKPGKILIRIEVDEDQVMIWILDNGVGFQNRKPNKPNVFKSTSFGIKGIQERIHMINDNYPTPLAHLLFDEPHKEPGYTTQVAIFLPRK